MTFGPLFAAAASRTGAQLRDDALDLLERVRKEYVDHARVIAFNLYCRHGYVTVDMIREVYPPPKEVDGRLMGSLLRARDGWRVDESRKIFSTRKINHGKRIAALVRVE